jgi:periodic tryptophan protein 2
MLTRPFLFHFLCGVRSFCFVTFANHTAPVTACHWSGSGNVLLTSSLDGTVRAYDLVRYRNFRTLATPMPAQLVSLAVDPAGEVVCAGAIDPFEIYVWSLQTGKLLDVLAGHQGPLSGLAFAGSSSSLLASSSWDKSVRLWDVFGGKGLVETLSHTADVLAVAFRPDGKELVSATLEGNLNFWNVSEGQLKGVIEGRRDIQGGRRVDDARAAENATHNTAFTTVTYSSDGSAVLAGGNSRFVCLYDVASKLLLRKFVISSNLSMDGLLDKLDSRRWTEAGGSMDLIDEQLIDAHEDDPEARQDRSLPGASRGDFSGRRTRLAVRSKAVRFAPTGAQWAVATTDGLLLYSLDPSLLFEPSELSMDVTPANVRRALGRKEFAAALVMALALNQTPLVQEVVESVPPASVSLVVRALPVHRLERFLSFLAQQLQRSAHLEFLLTWARTTMQIHAHVLAQAASTGAGAATSGSTAGGSSGASALLTTFRLLAKTLGQAHRDVAQLCNDNTFTLDYLAHMHNNQHAQLRIMDKFEQAKTKTEENMAGAAAAAAGSNKSKTVVKREKV